MKASSVGIILIIIGVLALLSGLGLDINICGVAFALVLLYFGVRMLYVTNRAAVETQDFVIPTTGATRARVDINHGLGKLNVGAARLQDMVAEGRITSNSEPEAEMRGDEVRAQIGACNRAWPMLLVPWKWDPLHWELGLTTALPMELEVNSGLSDLTLDLSQMKLSKFKFGFGLGSAKITMPAAAGYTKAKVSFGLSSVDVFVPASVAARIEVEGLGGSTVDMRRFPKVGKYYQSPDYETAANKLDLKVEYGLGAINVK